MHLTQRPSGTRLGLAGSAAIGLRVFLNHAMEAAYSKKSMVAGPEQGSRNLGARAMNPESSSPDSSATPFWARSIASPVPSS